MHQKLAQVQSSKSFYKQQWTNAVHELEILENKSIGSVDDQKSTKKTVAHDDNRCVL